MMRKGFVFVLFAFLCLVSKAQEFHCSVSVNVEKLQNTTQSYETSDAKKFAEDMKEAIETFINNRRWTALEFEQHEKIESSISLIISKRTSATDFVGQLSVQMRRPVYNSSYTSGLFNYMDIGDFAFTYNETQPLEFDANTFFDNLTSTLGYYVYIMLGIYFDSYGMMGGTAFYEMASNIAQTATSAPIEYKGWQQKHGQKARYWFSENHTNSAYDDLREAYYLYNRMGLDRMTKDQDAARASILQALMKLRQVNKVKNNVLSVTQFVDVKMQELTSIFTPAPDTEKKQVYLTLKEISPINANKLKDWNK